MYGLYVREERREKYRGERSLGEEIESKLRRWRVKDDISWMYGSSCIPNLVC
jgi:hypothetical protein